MEATQRRSANTSPPSVSRRGRAFGAQRKTALANAIGTSSQGNRVARSPTRLATASPCAADRAALVFSMAPPEARVLTFPCFGKGLLACTLIACSTARGAAAARGKAEGRAPCSPGVIRVGPIAHGPVCPRRQTTRWGAGWRPPPAASAFLVRGCHRGPGTADPRSIAPFLPSRGHQPLSALLLDECHRSAFFSEFTNCALIRRPNHSLAQFAQPIHRKPRVSPTASNRNPMCCRPALPCSMRPFTLPPTRGCKSVRQPRFCAFRCHSLQNCRRFRRTAHARGT